MRLALKARPALVTEIAQRLLAAHFAESIHEDILNAVGLSLEPASGTSAARNPAFRARVLTAYQYRCALCGLDIRIGLDPRGFAPAGSPTRSLAGAPRPRSVRAPRSLPLARSSDMTVGLDAAHIEWHQAGGPDTEPNGLALCSLHHELFDLGAFTVDSDHRVLVSERVNGTGQLNEILLRHHGQVIGRPVQPGHVPAAGHLAWHGKQVFKGKPRPLG